MGPVAGRNPPGHVRGRLHGQVDRTRWQIDQEHSGGSSHILFVVPVGISTMYPKYFVVPDEFGAGERSCVTPGSLDSRGDAGCVMWHHGYR